MQTRRRVRPYRLLPLCLAVTVPLIAVVASARAAEINYEFHAQSQGARAWLAGEGFEFKLDADNAARSRFALGERGPTLEALGPAEPLIARPGLNIAQPARLTVTWGVARYPAGANWDIGANNEAIMVMVSFGTESLSGGLFVPPSPYFIGFFLCEKGRRGILLTGRSYTRQGRYMCLDGPAPGLEITSGVPLHEHFRAAFPGVSMLPVTGFAIEADTTQLGRDARSSAWIKSVKIGSPN